MLFEFHASAFLSKAHYHLGARVDNSFFDVQWPQLAAYLVNKYAKSITIDEYGFGYLADLPDNVVLALKYIALRRTRPSIDEVEAIVANGTTDLHNLRKKLGAYDENMRAADLFLKDVVGRGFNLCFKDYPKLVLYTNSGAEMRIECDAKSTDAEFLRRVLGGELTREEMALLNGIALLRENTQVKQMQLLSCGQLTASALVKTLCRAAGRIREEGRWLSLVEWLRRNGYDREASEVFAKKTLVEG